MELELESKKMLRNVTSVVQNIDIEFKDLTYRVTVPKQKGKSSENNTHTIHSLFIFSYDLVHVFYFI